MKILTTILFLLSISFTTAQTKRKLLKEIIKTNSFHSKHIGGTGMISSQYSNFEKLRGMITDDELEALTHHKNAVVRLYAKQWMIQEGKGNLAQFLLEEIEKDKRVETFSGCILSDDKTYSIVYHEYWNKIRVDALEPFDYDSLEGKAAKAKVLKEDKKMQELDSIVLYSDKSLFCLLYDRSLSNRKLDEKHLPPIKKLAFTKHNGYALEYLLTHYTHKTKEEIENYLKTDFSKKQFNEGDEIFHLHEILVSLLETGNEQYKAIAVAKLKSDKSWEDHKSWFKNTIIDKYHLQL